MTMGTVIRKSRALPIVLLMIGAMSVQAQMIGSDPNSKALTSKAKFETAGVIPTDRTLARQALNVLKRLQNQVVIYRSLNDFETSSAVARVSLETFNSNLADVTAELEPLLQRMSDRKLRTYLSNALDSYRDGTFWWSRIEPAHVITLQRLNYRPANTSVPEAFFASTIPYTTVIHWRQAERFLSQAERIITPKTKL